MAKGSIPEDCRPMEGELDIIRKRAANPDAISNPKDKAAKQYIGSASFKEYSAYFNTNKKCKP